MGGVICTACRDRRHDDCQGDSWCDCQHKELERPTEPPYGWVRQG
jgi:hypothetical protein